jgi:hypothetical protein
LSDLKPLARPARLAPWLRFGDAIQECKATLQHRAKHDDGDVGDILQAEVADVFVLNGVVARTFVSEALQGNLVEIRVAFTRC